MTVILAQDARKGYARDQLGSEFLTSSINAKSFAELNKTDRLRKHRICTGPIDRSVIKTMNYKCPFLQSYYKIKYKFNHFGSFIWNVSRNTVNIILV